MWYKVFVLILPTYWYVKFCMYKHICDLHSLTVAL